MGILVIVWTAICAFVGLILFTNPENIHFIAQYPQPGQREKYGFVESKHLVRFIVTMLVLAWILPLAVGGFVFL